MLLLLESGVSRLLLAHLDGLLLGLRSRGPMLMLCLVGLVLLLLSTERMGGLLIGPLGLIPLSLPFEDLLL